ncbi:SDR family NAD(P)-dependent oxidoreductase [Sphingobacterium alkalisoli]|uniref:SDR family NAD(P)-dependent oxidoreductase n=1 Tax=Sphingobacterium alkalisoli TaxID=1874115 RepID=A0A4U0H2L1_9SPHI|nr:SDR family NAD(P)-dependent oxidoreductase [Sphingobacterium alkalisoli]TJY65855.1 SDR family NAD(P)-dependent oxidoreductase [Sphingobacterium alkalisoli]GGH17844.1 short-chain dehydrogenase [Sphingobacterium alkalisoli]
MKTALITGANKGIGLETAKQLLGNRFYVYIGSRDLQKGLEVAERLKAEGFPHVEAIQIDVTDDDSVKNARIAIGNKTDVLDVLINNAGISGVRVDENGHYIPQTWTASEASIDTFREVYETNVYGVVRVTQAFLDLLKRSSEPRIVMVSSTVGSLTLQTDPTWPAYEFGKYAVYGSSKSALNMYTVHLAYELKDTAFRINMVDPGYTKTDFTNFNGGEVVEAGKRVVKYALIGQEGPTGRFFSEETNPETGEIGW